MRLDGALEASELEDLHKEGLALLQRVNQCAASIFIAALPLGLTAREVFLVAYRFRMLQNSRAIEVLMGSRIFDASFTILRVLEAHAVLLLDEFDALGSTQSALTRSSTRTTEKPKRHCAICVTGWRRATAPPWLRMRNLMKHCSSFALGVVLLHMIGPRGLKQAGLTTPCIEVSACIATGPLARRSSTSHLATTAARA